MWRTAAAAMIAMVLQACAGGATAPRSGASLDQLALTPATSATEAYDYRIGPSDKLRVSVFQVPELTYDSINVDASGQLQMPFVGTLIAAGQTPGDLAAEIKERLSARYLRDPQVAVTVVEAANQKVTVDGAVTKPGVYQMRGSTTLLQAVAMAEGPTRSANLRQVAVFRTVDSRRQAAVFDLAAIRSGSAADPVLRGDDVVVVDTSRLSAAIRDILAVLPGLAVFAYI